MCIVLHLDADDRCRKQIIEEQLAFPSGTATAQLISVLHRLPPPDTSIRHRTAYRELPTDDIDTDEIFVTATTSDGGGDGDSERGVVQEDGWKALTWSFIASSVMTVSVLVVCLLFVNKMRYSLQRIFSQLSFRSLCLDAI
jgi:uncharacterized oligopeptide transporter (OPT) family protein